MRTTVYPLIRTNGWIFRVSVSDSTNIMIIASAANGDFIMRYFTEEHDAQSFIEAVSTRIH